MRMGTRLFFTNYIDVRTIISERQLPQGLAAGPRNRTLPRGRARRVRRGVGEAHSSLANPPKETTPHRPSVVLDPGRGRPCQTRYPSFLGFQNTFRWVR